MEFAPIMQFAGGVGLFLLGMRLMSDGLKFAAGPALRDLLAAATGSFWKAVGSGIAVTALVQSSSAVVFATIGFVNAGLLSLRQAVGVVFGTNVGTTLTSWIVALVGFDIKLQAYALPAVALGMGGWLLAKGRRAALGQAVVGVGVFFLGLDVLKSAFAGIDQAWAVDGMLQANWSTQLLFLGAGIVLTVLMQSSSAALAVTLTAASQGLLPLPAAAAMVIGANVGTTSTALFASVGATSAARRTAAAHVVFNVYAGTLGFIGLPWLLALASWLAGSLGGEAAPATVLALVHTLLNAVGLIAIWPLTPHLVHWLERHFAASGDAAGATTHLDRTVLATPELAINAVALELKQLAKLSHRLARVVLSQEPSSTPDISADLIRHGAIAGAILEFVPSIETGGVARLESALPLALRVVQYCRSSADLVADLSSQPVSEAELQPELIPTLTDLHRLADQALQAALLGLQHDADRSETPLETSVAAFEECYQQGKRELLRLGSRGVLGSIALTRVLDRASGLRRIVQQLAKAGRSLHSFDQLIRGASL